MRDYRNFIEDNEKGTLKLDEEIKKKEENYLINN